MALQTTLETHGFQLSEAEEKHIRHQLAGLERRLVHRPAAKAVLVLTQHPSQRQVRADFRVQLSPLGSHVVSHQSGDTPSQAVRLAVDDVERQLERRLAKQRGEPAFGVLSRREPRHPSRRRASGPPPPEDE